MSVMSAFVYFCYSPLASVIISVAVCALHFSILSAAEQSALVEHPHSHLCHYKPPFNRSADT